MSSHKIKLIGFIKIFCKIRKIIFVENLFFEIFVNKRLDRKLWPPSDTLNFWIWWKNDFFVHVFWYIWIEFLLFRLKYIWFVHANNELHKDYINKILKNPNLGKMLPPFWPKALECIWDLIFNLLNNW